MVKERIYSVLNLHAIRIQIHVPGGGGSLAEPDPYTGGEGLVTCYTRSCSAGMQ